MISKDKKRVALSVDEKQLKELKHKAIDAGMNLSEYLVGAGSITNPETLRKKLTISG